MGRTYVRRCWVLAAVLALAAPLAVVSSQAAQAQTPGSRANQLEDDLKKLERAESALRTKAKAARASLVVANAKWDASKTKLAAAEKDAKQKSAQAKKAGEKAEAKRAGVAAFAADVYQNPVDSSIAVASGVAAGDPMAQARGMVDLRQVSAQRASTLDGYEASKLAWDVFAKQAKRAERRAASLEAQLQKQTTAMRAKAKTSTDALSAAVDKVNSLQSKIDKLEAAERKRIAKLAAEKRAKRLKKLAEMGLTGGSGGGGGSMRCGKSANLNYPNGLIPQSALCPLPQAGWFLRADAARHFYKMNAAYRARFGSDMCVNSAYRPLQRQQQLYAVKPPGYAAVPGTSNHGWGTAVDLGCGINQFGTAQHNWVRNKGPRWGFVHPAWARGSVQEPWHFEYNG